MRGKLAIVMAVACMGMLGASAFAEDMDNPQYKNWAQFKPGTSVTTKMDINGQMKMTTTTTTTLKEVKPDSLTLETSSKMSMGGNDMPGGPAQTQEVKAKVPKVDAPAGQAKTDAKEGTDKVDVSGTSYDCKTVESTSEANGMKTQSKVWTSDKIPGMMVKMESHSTGAMTSDTTMTVTEVKMGG